MSARVPVACADDDMSRGESSLVSFALRRSMRAVCEDK
jgi:hypothetical protein